MMTSILFYHYKKMRYQIEFIFTVSLLESTFQDVSYKVYAPIRSNANACISWFKDIVELNPLFDNFSIRFISETLHFIGSFESYSADACSSRLELLLDPDWKMKRTLDIYVHKQTQNEDSTVTNTITENSYFILCKPISIHLSPVEETLLLPSLDVH
jgi:hypothetical protein